MNPINIRCEYNTGEAIEFQASSMKRALRLCKDMLDNPTRPWTLVAHNTVVSGVVFVNNKPVYTIGMRPAPSFVSEYAHKIFKGA